MNKNIYYLLTVILTVVCFGQSSRVRAQQDGYWEFHPTPKLRSNYGVYMQSPSTMFFFGGNLRNDSISTITLSDDTLANWSLITDNVNSMLLCHDIFNDNYFVAAGRDGVFVIGILGDKSKNFKASGLQDHHLYDVKMLAEDRILMVGGSKAGDEGNIWKSADKGGAWSSVYQNPNKKLYGMGARNTGRVLVGGEGIALYSEDSGNSWTEATLPTNAQNRQWRDFSFGNDNLVIGVGGRLVNDSIASIIRSLDGGKTWQLVLDSIAPQLNAVHMLNSNDGYAVGNDGIVLITADGGITWDPVDIDINVNDDRNLHDVHFIGKKFGVLAGERGKAIYYKNTDLIGPELIFSRIEKQTNGDITCFVELNPQGITTDLEMLYSTDQSNFQSETIGSYDDQTLKQLELPFDKANGLYWIKFKATNAAGVTETKILTVYRGPNEIPNFDFEEWTTSASDRLKQWSSAGKIQRVDLGNGNYAVRMQAVLSGQDQEPGAIFYADPSDDVIQGGIGYTDNPTKLHYRMRYEAAPGDSIMVIISFRDDQGNELAYESQKYTGQQNSFADFELSTNLNSSAAVDTCMVLFVSTNILGGTIDTNSFLELDSVWFEGATEKLPNNSLNNWTTAVVHDPVSWMVGGSDQQAIRLEKADAVSGNYALSMESNAGMQYGYPRLKNYPDRIPGYDIPGFKVSQAYSSLHGYYAFESGAVGDTLNIMVGMYKDGNRVAFGNFRSTVTQSTMIPFEAPINYQQQVMPDSAAIEINIRNPDKELSASACSFKIDLLSFNTPLVPEPSSARSFRQQNEVTLYPNPSTGSFRLEGLATGTKVQLYDAKGSLLETLLWNGDVMNPAPLQPGIYWVVYPMESGRGFKKLLIRR